MKQVAHIMTGIRIICSLVLLFLKPLSFAFLLIYLTGVLSDMLDGFIARKMNVVSKTGAVFDSIADVIFMFALLIILLPYFKWPVWSISWVTAIFAIRLTSLMVGFFRYRTFAFLHTYANKATGLALFCFPFLYSLYGFNITAILLCGLATVSALEELVINIISTTLNRDIIAIFSLKTQNR